MRLRWSFSSDTCELEAIPQKKKNRWQIVAEVWTGPHIFILFLNLHFIDAFYEYVMNSGDFVLLCTGKSLKDLSKDGMFYGTVMRLIHAELHGNP